MQIALLEQSLGAIKEELCSQPPEEAVDTNDELQKEVRKILRTRRLREELFGADLFGDPAWDILLDAFATELSGKRTSVSGLCLASHVPATTALRWVRKLEQDGWLVRTADPLDGRRHWMGLSREGSEKLTRFFDLLGAGTRSL